MTSLDKLMAYSAFAFAETLLTQPLLLVAGSKADTLRFSKTLYGKANCQKELFMIDGATHVDLYDVAEYVDPAIDKLDKFFKTTCQQKK